MADTDASQLLPITEIARRSGFRASALRYYEQLGLIEAQRAPGGQRRYQRNVLRRLAFIRAATNVGLSLDEIAAELTELPGNRTPSRADWQRLSAHWQSRLDEQISALRQLRDGLTSCIGCGCLSMESCALSNPADAAGRSGAVGAAYLNRVLTRRPPSSTLP